MTPALLLVRSASDSLAHDRHRRALRRNYRRSRDIVRDPLRLGAWDSTPFGPIVDVMIEHPDGHRVLIAPTAQVGRFISETYGFDEVRVESIALDRTAEKWLVTTDSLRLELVCGRRSAIGWLLVAVPGRLARSRFWCRLINPFARLLRPGVRTIGTAGNGREERYCALDEHRIISSHVVWDATDLGGLAPIVPPVRFGFGSTPRRPSLVAVTTFVESAPAVASPRTTPSV